MSFTISSDDLKEEHERSLEEGEAPVLKRRFLNRHYANISRISHSNKEFFIDFMQMPPDGDQVDTVRVYLSPTELIQLSDAIEDNIQKFLNKFGKNREDFLLEEQESEE